MDEPDFIFDMPKSGRRLSKGAAFEELVVKKVVEGTRDPDRVRYALKRAYHARTGVYGLSVGDLFGDDFAFPARLHTVRCKPASLSLVMRDFTRTSLFQCWADHSSDSADWYGVQGKRAMAFSWIGWGCCVLHDMTHLPDRLSTLRLLTPAGVVHIDKIEIWASALCWDPPCLR